MPFAFHVSLLMFGSCLVLSAGLSDSAEGQSIRIRNHYRASAQQRSEMDSNLPSWTKRAHLSGGLQLKKTADAALKAKTMRLRGQGAGNDSIEREDLQVFLNGIPVHGMQLTRLKDRSGIFMELGRLPSDEAKWSASDKWPDVDAVRSEIRSYAAARGKSLRFEAAPAQVFVDDEKSGLIAAWSVDVFLDGKPHAILSDGRSILQDSPLYFEIDGEASVYAGNPNDAVETLPLTNLLDSGFLETEYFETDPQGDVAKAYSADYSFVFDASDPRFIETNAFYHLLEIMQWYENLGYTWHSQGRLTLNLNEVIKDDTNNAYYQPNNGYPMIRVGNGDGVVLQNLGLDADVVAHEFGHHIIFQYLKTTSALPSLVLHEGLADFFTFAKTGDPCLGESICPENSNVCVVKGQCLRSAENELTYDHPEFGNLPPHQMGQIISGMLWTLHDEAAIGPDKTVDIAFSAISFLPAESEFEDFFLSLLVAEDRLYAGENRCLIMDEIKRRGFTEFAESIDCNTFEADDYLDSEGLIDNKNTVDGGVTIDPNAGETGGSGSSGSAAARKKRGKSSSSCGSIGYAVQGESSRSSALWLILLPLFALTFFRRKA